MRIVQAWGMTETSPLASVAHPPPGVEGDEAWARARAPGPAAAARRDRGIVGDDGAEAALGRRDDGRARGPRPVDRQRVLRGPGRRREVPRRLAAHRRHRLDRRATARSASPTARRTSSSPAASGSRRSTSRTRSWPTRRCARRRVIAMPHERWAERPLACVVLARGRVVLARRAARAPRSDTWRSGGCPTRSRSSTRSRRRASASSTRRCCARSSAAGELSVSTLSQV